MINANSLKAVFSSTFSKKFRKPSYDAYSFNKIPGTIATLLGSSVLGPSLPKDCYEAATYDAVILLFVDGFGFHIFERFKERVPALKRMEEKGIVSCISSLFPSTTAAHVTFLHTNLLPIQTGIYEWFYYEPLVDDIIAPLPFKYARDFKTETLQNRIEPSQLFPFPTLYKKLKNEGISSYILQDESISDSTYSRSFTQGADRLSYKDLSDACKKTLDIVSLKDSFKQYIHLYFGDIDAIGHRQGLHTKEYETEVIDTFATLEQELLLPLKTQKKKVAICLIADHGMVEVNPKKTHYLNVESKEILEYIPKLGTNSYKAPAGSCRDFFIHTLPGKEEMVLSLLRPQLEGIAEVYLTKTLLEEGFFSKEKPTQLFLDRVGDVVVLPYEKEAVFWYEKHRFEQHFYGAHGGITPEELDTLFAFYVP